MPQQEPLPLDFRALERGLLLVALAVGLVAVIFAAAFRGESLYATCGQYREEEPDSPLLGHGAVHHYALDASGTAGSRVCDSIGDADGAVIGDVRFDGDGARFDGASAIELPDRPEFSAASHPLTVVAVLSVEDWGGGSPYKGYVHWMGKGQRNAQEWAFRHYTDDAPDADRRGRVSFYAFSPNGGLGAGSYFESSLRPTRMVVTGMVTAGDRRLTAIWRDGTLEDRDPLDGYGVVPTDTDSPVLLGTRGDGTGYLVGTLRDVAFFDRALTDSEIAVVSRLLAR